MPQCWRITEFSRAAPNRVWVGDITYIATDAGWLFLAVLLDLFSRRSPRRLGWAMREDMTSAIILDALRVD